MAGLNSASNRFATREQLAAIAELRWRIFVNSLRTLRGRLELVSRILAGIGYSIIGIGGTLGLGVLAWYIVSRGHLEWLAVPLWGILLYWQFFPVVATAFVETFDAQNLLRFPLRYRSYFLMRLVYGSLEPTTLVALLWLAGLAAGIGAQAPRLLPWALLVLAAFAAFNISLSRAIFSWIERWLARRKSREILALFLFAFVIGVQFISPLTNYYLHHHNRLNRPSVFDLAPPFISIERFSPPGLTSSAVSRALHNDVAPALGAFALLCLYTIILFGVLHLRLLAQYRGEDLSEAPALASARTKSKEAVPAGWDLGGLSGSVAAILEKEFHYLSRSGPMLFTLVMPVVILVIFRFGLANARHSSNFFEMHIGFAFPIGAAYALLILSGFAYNCFGTEGPGVQFYFLSPVQFREVLLAKNLAQGTVLLGEVVLVWIAVALLFHPPSVGVTLATLAGVILALLVTFTVGNWMSLYAPKKIDWAAFGKQGAAAVTGFAVLGVQTGTLGLAVIAVLVAAYFHQTWVATVLLLLFAAGALCAYIYALSHIDAIAVRRCESMIAELCRT
jgi:ABC-2 type transport system permease protein